MKKMNLLLLSLGMTTFAFAQQIDQIIHAKEVERIERILSADDMEGRDTFSKGIDKAATFIADEFKKTGLQTWKNSDSYLQSFVLIHAKFLGVNASFNGIAVDSKDVMVITCQPELNINETSGYEKVSINKGANFGSEARKYIGANKNYFVLVDPDFAKNFKRLAQLKSLMSPTDKSVVFVLASQHPETFAITAKHTITERKLANVVGVLPGKSKKNEYVIFSAHYDHIGINSAGAVNGDSIYNGANDDAAGTTAMMLLAQYFKAMGNNERTIIFAAFTAEELGMIGSTHFSNQFQADDVKAMFNIEMIGTESKWGRNSAFITGFDQTDMGKILQANLSGTGFTFHPDPYPQQDLFYRSDNATLARLGVPAHTISTAKMEDEPHYHKASDEIGTLDMENMTMIIKAIALSSRGIVSGKETPSRVDTRNLR